MKKKRIKDDSNSDIKKISIFYRNIKNQEKAKKKGKKKFGFF